MHAVPAEELSKDKAEKEKGSWTVHGYVQDLQDFSLYIKSLKAARGQKWPPPNLRVSDTLPAFDRSNGVGARIRHVREASQRHEAAMDVQKEVARTKEQMKVDPSLDPSHIVAEQCKDE